MKIIFFGLGSIGKRHVRLLRETGAHEIYALRTKLGDAPEIDMGVTCFSSWDQVDNVRPQVAFITNPTALHVPTAIECARRGMALFIEKPLGDSMDGCSELLDLVRARKLPTYVAFVLRFHLVIEKLRELTQGKDILHLRCICTSFLPLWRLGRDHLKGYSAQRALGGGVIADLSHEIDYIGWLLGGVTGLDGRYGRRGKITIDSEDYADILLTCPRSPANLHINFLSQQSKREITLDCADATFVGDIIEQKVRVFRAHKLVEEIACPVEPDDIFRRQHKYFFSHLDDEHMMNDIFEAAGLMEKVLAWRNEYAAA